MTFLASAKGEFQLEGFTINMTSLDDIFIQATRSGRRLPTFLTDLYCMTNVDLNNSYKREDTSEEQKSEEEREGYVPRHQDLEERASLDTSAVYVDPNISTHL